MAFPDHLVKSLLDVFSPQKSDLFFDPYCGSGTSLVEAQRYGLRCFGVDANPVSVLASEVKTNSSLEISVGHSLIERLEREKHALRCDSADPILAYLVHSGMISRGWIAREVASDAIALRRWIDRTVRHGKLYKFFMLAFITTVVNDLANVRFGPEIYCVPPPLDLPDIFVCFSCRINAMLDEFQRWNKRRHVVQVRLGDSRDGRTIRTAVPWSEGPVYVITSPPYPTEHDYTRNSRLELVFMEKVGGLQSLREIKRRMIRSHSKGIYVGDRDYRSVRSFAPVRELVSEIDSRIQDGASGFEGQYTKVISNYFGGMLRHFRTLERYLKANSKLAYVVGDEASYKGVYVPTGQVLAELVDTYLRRVRVDRVVEWRSRRPGKARRELVENVMILSVK